MLRKFAYYERLQLREIVDLLKWGIIKESRSLYCARNVPVRKKNGKLKLCVDLRPLKGNQVKISISLYQGLFIAFGQ